LNTWSLSMKGRVNSSIIPAQNAVEAVEKAIAAAEAREKHNKL
jgi:hypothetical protein